MDIIDFSDDFVPLEVELYESVQNIPKVLGKFKGTFFVPDGVSRNKRFYPENLWRKAIGSEPVQESLRDGMLGTLLHPEAQPDGRQSKFAHPIYSSHVVKNLWIDQKKAGMGEGYVLDTPVGRIIETFQKSKLVKLYVSSRAWGKYEDGRKKDGLPVVDEHNYVLKTFDFVLEPGFLEAKPQFNEQMLQLAECYLGNMGHFDMPKAEQESRARKLVRDVDFVLG